MSPGTTNGAAPHASKNDAPTRHEMKTYVILRRRGWDRAELLAMAAERSGRVATEMSDEILWLRSYVLAEGGSKVGTVCIYQAISPEAIRTHASRAVLPVDEIIEVADVVIAHPDPEPVP